METSTTLEWVKRPNGDWVTTNGLYVIIPGPPRNKKGGQLYWAEDNEQLSDRPGNVAEMKELAQIHMDQCVKAGQEAVADVAVPPEQVQAVAEEIHNPASVTQMAVLEGETYPDTQSLVSSDPDATADHPMMRQYADAKARHPEMVLLFRMGDFYESFNEDAELLARVLNLTLTHRDNIMPMAGFPHHSLEQHLRKLLSDGHRVAICEQEKTIGGEEIIESLTAFTAFIDDREDNNPNTPIVQEGIAEVVETDVLAETLVDGIEDVTNPVASPETVDEVLAAVPPSILPTSEQIEAATIAVESMPLTEYKKETSTLVWIPIPQPKINDTSVWTLWLSECGKYRVHLSCDTLGGADHYFGASVRKPKGVKRLDSVEFGAWDAVDHGRSGFVRYKTLVDALEAAAHHFREATEQPDYAPDNDDVLAYAGQHDLLKLPEPKQKDKKAVSEPTQKSDNKPKAKSVPSKTEEKSVMKISEKEARSMCIAVGYKSMGDAKNCPITKVQHRINTAMLAGVDDLEVPDHDDDKKTLKRVLESLRKGQEIVVVPDTLDESMPEEDAAEEKAARADKGDKKEKKAKVEKAVKEKKTPKAETEPSKSGHVKAEKKTNNTETGPSNKEVVYKLWKKKPSIEPQKCFEEVNEAVKLTTIRGWINQWKNGNNLPACAKE